LRSQMAGGSAEKKGERAVRTARPPVVPAKRAALVPHLSTHADARRGGYLASTVMPGQSSVRKGEAGSCAPLYRLHSGLFAHA